MTPPTRPLSPRPRPAPTPRLHLGLRTCGFSLPRHPPRLLAPRGLPLHERGCLRRGGSSGRGSAPQSRPRPTAPPALPPPAPLHPRGAEAAAASTHSATPRAPSPRPATPGGALPSPMPSRGAAAGTRQARTLQPAWGGGPSSRGVAGRKGRGGPPTSLSGRSFQPPPSPFYHRSVPLLPLPRKIPGLLQPSGKIRN